MYQGIHIHSFTLTHAGAAPGTLGAVLLEQSVDSGLCDGFVHIGRRAARRDAAERLAIDFDRQSALIGECIRVRQDLHHAGLDEIGGGLTDGEAAELVRIIQAIRADGIAIVWIEHIVHILVQVVERLVCMDAGRVIAEGVPADVLRDATVIDAYLGTHAHPVG